MRKRTSLLVAAVGAAALVLAPVTAASALTITSGGPLIKIDISETLNCAVNHAGDENGEFYADTACGTFVAASGVLYGPESVPAGPQSQTTWTPVSQSQTGTGTTTDPYQITTVVSATGLQLTQLDSYVTGEHHYRTSTTIENTTDADIEATVYHAADCYLGDNDRGFGRFEAATGAVTCVAPDSAGNPSAASRIEQFTPVTTGSNYLYSSFGDVWRAVESKQPLPNEVRNGNSIRDNGIGLSWTSTLAAHTSKTFERTTDFSPVDVATLLTTLVADPASIPVNEEATVRATIVNDNPDAQDLNEARVTLPDGVSYVTGSTNGLPEPTVTGNVLVFEGPALIAANGSLAFDFKVSSALPGDFTLRLEASTASRVDVTPSTASLSVTRPALPTSISVAPQVAIAGSEVTATASIVNPHTSAHDISTITLTLPAGSNYVAGSLTAGTGFTGQPLGEPTISGDTLTFTGPFTVEPQGELKFTLGLTIAAVGEHSIALNGAAVSAQVVSSSTALTVTAPVLPTDSQQNSNQVKHLANTGSPANQMRLLGGVAMLLFGTGIALTVYRARASK